MKTIHLVLIILSVFLIGAFAGKLTGWPTAVLSSSSSDSISAKLLNVRTIFSYRSSNIDVNNTLYANDGLRAYSGPGIGIYGSSDTGYGVKGFSNSGYAGYFSGGKGIFAENIEFGAASFGGTKGFLVLFAAAGVKCTDVCITHSLGCTKNLILQSDKLYERSGCTSRDGNRLCICGTG